MRIALTIAGSDSGGGAGIQADLKTFQRFGVFGTSAITAVTAQNTVGVSSWEAVSPGMVRAQIDAVAQDLFPGAFKTGMLANAAVASIVAAAIREHSLRNYVLDPVMVATSGDVLFEPDTIEVIRRELLPQASLVTPNLPEAAALLDAPLATTETMMCEQGERLLALGTKAVLMKGGHAGGPESIDLLVEPSGVTRLIAERVATKNTHGTGCTLSAAIAAGLAKSVGLSEAVREAKAYVSAAIAAADRLHVGSGHGPVHHFHAWW